MVDVVFSKFPHIEQFRTVIKRVTDTTRWVGRDENGEPIFDHSKILPKLKYTGTVKLHGTNAGVGIMNDGTQWAQSRENIITPEKDNAGFATFAYANRALFASIADSIRYDKGRYKGMVIYGEWCGGNIQKGIALTQLPKMFVVFAIKLLSTEDEDRNLYLCDDIVADAIGHHEEERVFNIYTFPTWELEIDFNDPAASTNDLVDLTTAVGHECPVGKYFGVSGIGEGICWHSNTAPYRGGDYMFKVKDERHNASKVKTIAPVDVEKVANIKECVEKIITDNRMNQGLDHLRMNQMEIIPENLGHFIKWVVTDAIREELDTIIESGLEPKDVSKAANAVVRKWFFENTQFTLK